MHRRDFLRLGLLAGGLYACPGLILPAQAAVTLGRRTLVSVTLAGGPDFRHLFAPGIAANQPADSYAARWWAARAASQGIAVAQRNIAGYAQRYTSAYLSLNQPGTAVSAGAGILASCGWLKEQWDAGNVAMIHNVIGATSRDHAHSLLVMDQGDRGSGAIDRKPGWGGRLAALLGGTARVGALTKTPRPFCLAPSGNGQPPNADLVLNLANSRKLALAERVTNPNDPVWKQTGSELVLARSLKSYYAGRNFNGDPALARLARHERALRELGAQVTAQLGGGETLTDGARLPVPDAIRALYSDVAVPYPSRYWGGQIRNLHDVLALSGVVNTPVLSMEYGGWDTHKLQRDDIEGNFIDLFGKGRGFDLLWQNLDATARRNLVLVIYGEFGRQLAANGDQGTDHGRGNAVLVIGESVKGGMYGTPFPEREIPLFARGLNDDIQGLTGVEHVFGAVADWVAGGSTGNNVVNRSNALIESGLRLDQLFA
ncbi:DUF1501 domain-containing protein [Chitiniphilus purpureus]|uniref:DUF1501 domain-containing protein n=1 Tax=Chitiniphilus purpureus TaxID=2981137 RepID=A0ABY6DLZ9_9NEIS|nr:DUF1501 domain-containing protein [Chitiniphilus sp. CD1]UXY15390.1 DUF1501 domain-containing protein [Chitiniphilus sp. CD1]